LKKQFILRMFAAIFFMCQALLQYALDPNKEITQYIHNVWGIEDGLPQNTVYAIIQTREGYLWLGTQEGLVRFDGVRFKTFDKRNVEQLLDNCIQALYEDQEGNLWIGTDDGGLTCMKDGKFTTFTKREGLSNNRINAICEDREGSLWIGTDKGLNRLSPKDGKITTYTTIQGLSHNIVLSLYEGREGSLWIGTSAGLNHLKTGTFTRYTTKEGLPNHVIRSICEDQEGSLWIGTYGGGLIRMKAGTFTRYTSKDGLSNDMIYVIYKDREGSLWIGTDGGGLNRLNHPASKDGKFTFTAYTTKQGFSYNMVSSIYEDSEGSLWIGTNGGGLNRLKEGKCIAYTTEEGLSNDMVCSIYENREGSLWIGTAGGGLNRLDLHKKNGKFTAYTSKKGLSNDIVTCVYKDREGILWLGTYGGGLNRFKDGKFTIYTTREGLSHNVLRSICEDQKGNLWVGTDGGGLNRLTPQAFQKKDGRFTFTTYTTEDGLSDNRIRPIYEDQKGNLWIGTVTGELNLFKDGKFTVYTIREGFSNDIRYIYEDQEGILWIGTGGGGLSRLKDGKFTSITSKDGLFDDTVHQILEDDRGNFWMGCNKGIFRVSKKELNDFCEGKRDTGSVHSVSYDEKDGMKSRECNGISQPSGWKSRDGKLWFPTIKGVVLIDPNNIKLNQQPPPVKIEEIIVDNKKIQLPLSPKEEKLVLSPGNERFEILYTGLSLLVPERVRFKYKLEGFDKEWNEVGTRRTAYYTKIPPGRYTFRVKACNNDQVWNETGASISVYLKPYFYQTWWFYLVCGLGIIFLVFGAYRWRVRWLKSRKEELETLVAQRTHELQMANEIARKEREIAEAANQSKSEFLARMSHEIRTPLNSVIGFSEMLVDTDLNEEQLDYANTISRSGEALLLIIDDILDFSKIEAGILSFDPIDFDPEVTAFDVCELIVPKILDQDIEVLCQIGDEVPAFVKHDPGRFRQVLTNLMGNAAKFTEKGEIELTIDVEEEDQNRLKLHSCVRDTGIGIPSDKLDSIFKVFQQADGSVTRKFGGTGLGLAICKQIAKYMGGDIWVESTPGKGSTFHFTAWVEKSKKTPGKKPVMTHLTGERVLIVDDNINHLNILEYILKRHGMRVVKRNGGEWVIPTIQENLESETPFDLCILDIRMPGMSGYDVANQIRTLDPPISNLPLLALSSSTTKQSQKYRESGFDGFLPKPVQAQKLLRMIERLLLLNKTRGIEDKEKEGEMITQHSLIEDAKHSVYILLAEDNPVNRKLAMSMLTKAGYQLDVVENGKEAVEKYTSDPDRYDLILMDIQMPEMDGREAAKIIRDKGFKDVPIIAMTAENMKGDDEKCLEAGMNDYIPKPIKREVVFEIIKRWVLNKW